MACKGPGRSNRKGVSLIELAQWFPDEETALQWFESVIWKDGRTCPRCGGTDTYKVSGNTNKMPYRCRDCKRYFSVKTGTALQSSKIPLQKWAWAIFLESTSLKGVSSVKLHRDIGISQTSAWHMLHRIREGLVPGMKEAFAGPVEVDETYIGGLEKNKHEDKKLNAGRGGVGKSIVVGIKDRETNQIVAKVVPDTTKATLQGFIEDTRSTDAPVFTDEHSSYQGLSGHVWVNHSSKQWTVSSALDHLAHTNGVESFWATFKRAFHGTYHRISKKHLNRYVGQFAGKHNIRSLDTKDQMKSIVIGMIGKRCKFDDLTAKVK